MHKSPLAGVKRPLQVFIALIAVLTIESPASAHSQLVSSDPANNATVTAPITSISFTFNENVQAKFDIVKVKTPSGVDVEQGNPTVVDTVVTQAIRDLPETGKYSISYRIVSADGHPVTNELSFNYTGPTSTAANKMTTVSETTQKKSNSTVFVIVPIVIIVLGVFLTLLRALRRNKQS